MNSFLWYLLESNLIILILFVVFLALKRRLNFSNQRYLLLSIPIFAYLVIGLKSFLPSNAFVTVPVVHLEHITVSNTAENSLELSSWLYGLFDITAVYWIGVSLFLAYSLFRFGRLLYVLLKNKIKKEEDYTLVAIEEHDSFSFFRFIQLRPDLENSGKQLVLEHEKIHVQKHHSVDILIMEFFHIISWFNPVFPIIKQELKKLHECEVDELMYARHKSKYMRFLVHYTLGTYPSPNLSNQFYHPLTIKKRLEIMKAKNQQRKIFVLIIPMLLFSTMLISWTNIDFRPSGEAEVFTPLGKGDPDVHPQFPGGHEALVKFMGDNIKYPKAAQKAGTQGTVYVEFVVGKDGSLSDFKIKKGVDKLLDEEALRVIKTMPKWKAGTKDGKKVAVKHVLPINFKL